MKRTFLALTMLALVLPALPQARGQEVSVDFFYNNLSGGNWIEAGDYGYGWQPDVAVNDPNWRPYADGYWAYTDDGWTWVSYEDFGGASYHYGPDYNLLSSRSSRPIQRLKIERQQNVDLSTAAKSGALTKVQGDKLFVGAPTKISKPAPGVAPPQIKTRVAQPKIANGWAGVAHAAQLKEKMKT